MELQIPTAILKLYLETFRCYPQWRTTCPDYTLPDVQIATELAYNTTLIKTCKAEYIFTFNQRIGFTDEIVDGLAVGHLQLMRDDTLVLELSASVSASNNRKLVWRPQTVRTFIEGPWVGELLGLASKQEAHERSLAELTTKEHKKDIEALDKWRTRRAASQSHGGPKPRCRLAKRSLWSRLWENLLRLRPLRYIAESE